MIRSRDNARVKRWAKLSEDGRFRRQEGKALVEGPHLVAALLEAGIKPACVLTRETMTPEAHKLALRSGAEVVELSDAVFSAVVDAETPQGIAAEIRIPEGRLLPARSTVFLEGIQDAGNVGAIIRSAAAFGIGNVVLDSQCADPWSPKVLRAGMGGHFRLAIRGVAALEKELEVFPGRVVCTVAREGIALAKADLSGRLGWVFGSEGKGLSIPARKNADALVNIPIAAGTESLNVAAAAAICFYEAFCRQPGGSSS